MQRYLLFSGNQFYPGGGWDDLRGEFATFEEAREKADKLDDDWFHIVDLLRREKISTD
jgi:hypothetical protein